MEGAVELVIWCAVGIVWGFLVAWNMRKSAPMPLEMEKEDARLDRERQALQARPLFYVSLVRMEPTPDRYADPFTLSVRREIEQMVRGQK